MSEVSLARSVLAARGLVLLTVVTRLSAALVLGLAVSRAVVASVGAHPAGELALFEGGAERLAELAPRLRVHPAWAIGAVVAYALSTIVPHGALVARATGRASDAAQALTVTLGRTGTLLLAYVASLAARVAALVFVVGWWPRWSGAGVIFLVVVALAAWAFAEGFVNLARAAVLSRGARLGEGLRAAWALGRVARAAGFTAALEVSQLLVAGVGVALAGRAFSLPTGGSIALFAASGISVVVSAVAYAAAHALIARGLPPADSSNGLPSAEEVGYETAPSVEASPGSSVGRAED